MWLPSPPPSVVALPRAKPQGFVIGVAYTSRSDASRASHRSRDRPADPLPKLRFSDASKKPHADASRPSRAHAAARAMSWHVASVLNGPMRSSPCSAPLKKTSGRDGEGVADDAGGPPPERRPAASSLARSNAAVPAPDAAADKVLKSLTTITRWSHVLCVVPHVPPTKAPISPAYASSALKTRTKSGCSAANASIASYMAS